jgi:hypothetical protein
VVRAAAWSRSVRVVRGATGSISTEDLVNMCHEMGVETDIDLDQSIALGRDIQQMVGHEAASAVLKAGKGGSSRPPIRRCRAALQTRQ